MESATNIPEKVCGTGVEKAKENRNVNKIVNPSNAAEHVTASNIQATDSQNATRTELNSRTIRTHRIVKSATGEYRLISVAPPRDGPSTSTGKRKYVRKAYKEKIPVPISSTSLTGLALDNRVPDWDSFQAFPNMTEPRDTLIEDNFRRLFTNFLAISSRLPGYVQEKIRSLMQDLLDMKVEIEVFCQRIEVLLCCARTPFLERFLEVAVPIMRGAMLAGEFKIEDLQFKAVPSANISEAEATNSLKSESMEQLKLDSVESEQKTINQDQEIQQSDPLIGPELPDLSMGTELLSSPQQARNITMPKLFKSSTGNTTSTLAANEDPGIIIKSGIVPETTYAQSSQVKNSFATTPAPKKRSIISNSPSKSTKRSSKSTLSLAEANFEKAAASRSTINDNVFEIGEINLTKGTETEIDTTKIKKDEIRSCNDGTLSPPDPLSSKFKEICSKHGLGEPSEEVKSLVSHTIEQRLRMLLNKLDNVTMHKVDVYKGDPNFEINRDVKGQLKILREMDRLERTEREESERLSLLNLAKDKTKFIDLEEIELQEKAKEFRRMEMEEIRQTQMNAAALAAIGPRKKFRKEPEGDIETRQVSGAGSSAGSGEAPRGKIIGSRPRLKKATTNDLLFILEQEKDQKRKPFIFKSYLR